MEINFIPTMEKMDFLVTRNQHEGGRKKLFVQSDMFFVSHFTVLDILQMINLMAEERGGFNL